MNHSPAKGMLKTIRNVIVTLIFIGIVAYALGVMQ